MIKRQNISDFALVRAHTLRQKSRPPYSALPLMPTPFHRSVRRLFLLSAAGLILRAGVGLAADTGETGAANTSGTGTIGEATQDVLQGTVDEVTPLNTLETQSVYVGTAPFREKEFRTPSPDAPDGVQSNYNHIDEVENTFEYGHRILLFDKVYLKLGVEYKRYDFGQTNAPLPSTLSTVHGEINFEYIVKGEPAAFINFNPGVYYGNSQISVGSFDFDIAAGTLFPVPYLKNVYGLFGLEFSLLAHYPVQPFGGLVWLINNHIRLQAVPEEPRLIYTVNKQLDFFAGGEVNGTAFKRNSDDDARPQFRRYSKGVIDFSEDRVGAGLTYTPIEAVDIDFSGGWDIHREFNYYRGDSSKRFITDGAPYAKIEISANF